MEKLNNETTQTTSEKVVKEQQTAVKKPKKLGWIISLVILSLSVIGLLSGVIIASTNNLQSITDSIEKGIKDNGKEAMGFPEKPIQSNEDLKNGLTYKVTKGNAFLVAIYNANDTNVPKLLVDGKEVKSFYSVTNTKLAGEYDVKVKSYYYVIAENDKMTIKTEGTGSDKTFPMLIVKSDLVSKVTPLMVSGLIILVSGIISLIALVPFIVFLTIFLKKNKVYKETQRTDASI